MNEYLDAHTITVLILIFIGLYCLISKRNMIKMIIGIEILSKGVTLNFIATGYGGIAQALVITVIVIDVVIVAVALSLIVNAYTHYGVINLDKLKRLRG